MREPSDPEVRDEINPVCLCFGTTAGTSPNSRTAAGSAKNHADEQGWSVPVENVSSLKRPGLRQWIVQYYRPEKRRVRPARSSRSGLPSPRQATWILLEGPPPAYEQTKSESNAF